MPEQAPNRIKRHRMPKREDTSSRRHSPIIALVLLASIFLLGNIGALTKQETPPELVEKFESMVTLFEEGTPGAETFDYCYLISKELRESGDSFRADYLLLLANGSAPDEETQKIIRKFIQDKNEEERYIAALQNSFHIIAEMNTHR